MGIVELGYYQLLRSMHMGLRLLPVLYATASTLTEIIVPTIQRVTAIAPSACDCLDSIPLSITELRSAIFCISAASWETERSIFSPKSFKASRSSFRLSFIARCSASMPATSCSTMPSSLARSRSSLPMRSSWRTAERPAGSRLIIGSVAKGRLTKRLALSLLAVAPLMVRLQQSSLGANIVATSLILATIP